MKKETDYSKKLHDPRWQKKRLQILERDSFTCCECGDKTKELQIHHTQYPVSGNPWDAEDDTLFTLCKECHGQITELIKSVRKNSMFQPYLCSVSMLDDLFKEGKWQPAFAAIYGIHRYFMPKKDNEN